ncbi:MAG TPA: (2Fe-2S)-binding protein, partial [Balneola sp.]|nr:(2Fe-2S)-binding protein [Balneola sp.]
KLFSTWGVNDFHFSPDVKDGFGDNFLLTDDQAPNTNGVKALGFNEISTDDLKTAIKSAKVIVLLNDELVDRGVLGSEDLEKPFVISLATNE